MTTIDPENQGPGSAEPPVSDPAPQDLPREDVTEGERDPAASPTAAFGAKPLINVRGDEDADNPICRPDGTCE